MAKKPRKFGAGGMSTMEKRITELDKPTRPVPPAAKKPPPKKPSGSASPPIPDWMLRGDNEDKAKGERGYKKYAKGGSVKRLAAGGLGSPPVPQPSTLPFKGAPAPAQGTMFNDARTAPPQMGGPGGPQMRGGPGSRPTTPQRPMMRGEDRAFSDRLRQSAATQIAMLKQNALRDQVWGPGSPNSLNPVASTGKPPAPAAPAPVGWKAGHQPVDYDDMAAARSTGALDKLNAERAAPAPEYDDMAAYKAMQAGGFGAAGAASRSPENKGYKKGGVVKKFAKGGTVKKSGASRGDGIAKRGRTKGKMR
jgi:hypothetical protein